MEKLNPQNYQSNEDSGRKAPDRDNPINPAESGFMGSTMPGEAEESTPRNFEGVPELDLEKTGFMEYLAALEKAERIESLDELSSYLNQIGACDNRRIRMQADSRTIANALRDYNRFGDRYIFKREEVKGETPDGEAAYHALFNMDGQFVHISDDDMDADESGETMVSTSDHGSSAFKPEMDQGQRDMIIVKARVHVLQDLLHYCLDEHVKAKLSLTFREPIDGRINFQIPTAAVGE